MCFRNISIILKVIEMDKRKLDAIHLFIEIYRALMIFTDTAYEMTMSHC